MRQHTEAVGRAQCLRLCTSLYSRICHAILSIVCPVLSFMLSDISGPRPISREDAHSMYLQYLRVYLCYNLLPTPPPISVRKAGGITVVYLCGY